jgi:hypothetical protein
MTDMLQRLTGRGWGVRVGWVHSSSRPLDGLSKGDRLPRAAACMTLCKLPIELLKTHMVLVNFKFHALDDTPC